MTLTKKIVAAVATASALASSARADQKTVSYNVAPGTCSSPIAVAANNRPVALSGTDIQNDIEGIGQVALLRANKNDSPQLTWAGADLFGTTRGISSNAGDHIMYLDNAGWTDVKTAASLHIQVCTSSNDTLGNAFGYLTFVY